MKIRWPQLLAFVTVLPGCAAMQEDWYREHSHPALAAYHFEVPESDLQRVCQGHPAVRTRGCAIRDASAKVCLIYTGPMPPAWLLDHELKHCAGWDHGDARDQD